MDMAAAADSEDSPPALGEPLPAAPFPESPLPPVCEPPPGLHTASEPHSSFVERFREASSHIMLEAVEKLVHFAEEWEQDLRKGTMPAEPLVSPTRRRQGAATVKVDKEGDVVQIPLSEGFAKAVSDTGAQGSHIRKVLSENPRAGTKLRAKRSKSSIELGMNQPCDSLITHGWNDPKDVEQRGSGRNGNKESRIRQGPKERQDEKRVSLHSHATVSYDNTADEAWSNKSSSVRHKHLHNIDGFIKILLEGDDRQENTKRLQRVSTVVDSRTFQQGCYELRKRIRYRRENMEILVDQAMGIVILVNTITIGLQSDIEEDSGGWLFVDAVFALLFLLESVMKLKILGCGVYFCGSNRGWNILEALLVVFAWAEILLTRFDIPLSLFRIIRLIRITRIVRVARLPFFTDLTMMINGAVGGMKTLLWSIVLISVPLYGVALILRETMGRENNTEVSTNFNSMAMSMFTVFRCVVAGDCSDRAGRPIFSNIQVGPWYILVYVVTLLLMTFGLFNVIVAIFVENTVAAAKYNDLHHKRERLLDQQVFSQKACELVENIWRVFIEVQPQEYEAVEDEVEALGWAPRAVDIVKRVGGLEISHTFFEVLRHDSDFQDLLRDLDIADDDQLDLFDTFDVDNSGILSLSELVFGIKKLRGDPRRSDVIANNLIGHTVLNVVDIMSNDFKAHMSAADKKMNGITQNMQALENLVQIILNQDDSTQRQRSGSQDDSTQRQRSGSK